jgi:hypothetical protein
VRHFGVETVGMREQLARHFDVVVVIWVLTLAVGWSLVALSRSTLTADQWSSAPHSGPAWVFDSSTD